MSWFMPELELGNYGNHAFVKYCLLMFGLLGLNAQFLRKIKSSFLVGVSELLRLGGSVILTCETHLLDNEFCLQFLGDVCLFSCD